MAAVAIVPSQAAHANYGSSILFGGDYLPGLCQVFTVVESESVINTCVSAPEAIVVGCSTIYLTEPTCIATIVTVSSTVTEDDDRSAQNTLPPEVQQRPPGPPNGSQPDLIPASRGADRVSLVTPAS